jgi:hypothetical protein
VLVEGVLRRGIKTSTFNPFGRCAAILTGNVPEEAGDLFFLDGLSFVDVFRLVDFPTSSTGSFAH